MATYKQMYNGNLPDEEAQRLDLTDLDPERNNVTIKASKNSNSRTLTISKELMDLFFSLPKQEKLVFHKKPMNSRNSSFHNQMTRTFTIVERPKLALFFWLKFNS